MTQGPQAFSGVDRVLPQAGYPLCNRTFVAGRCGNKGNLLGGGAECSVERCKYPRDPIDESIQRPTDLLLRWLWSAW
jgi:hypothetical protein